MGQVPVLNYKGQELIQSLTIARFVARKCDLAGKTEIDEFLADQVQIPLGFRSDSALCSDFDPIHSALIPCKI